jgi:1,4-dihydroxy-2-naphthoyl-CoA hydrolase
MEIDVEALNEARVNGPAGLLGIRFVEASKDRLVAELPIRDQLRTRGGTVHGGVLMALADSVGAVATIINLPPGARTTTMESKTNFLAASRADLVRAEATPIHKGRTTMVWQTRVTDETGRLISLTTQTQMVLFPKKT